VNSQQQIRLALPWVMIAASAVAGPMVAPLACTAQSLAVVNELTISGADKELVSIANLVVDYRGRIFVWQDEDHRIRRFESDGSELSPVGRAGEGPGEFRMRSMGLLTARSLGRLLLKRRVGNSRRDLVYNPPSSSPLERKLY
jgi:hypothetical protein